MKDSGYISSFKQVSPKRVSDFIIEQLEEAIFLKEVMPDEQLPPERELAQMFKASRLAVREAIAALEERGLIERRIGAKGGTFVLPITLKAGRYARDRIAEERHVLEELLEYRSIIEPEAAWLAAERITAEELEWLGMLIGQSEENCPRELFRSLDVKFHLLIAKASRNSFIESSVRQIRTKINMGLDLMPFDSSASRRSNEMHKQLLEALKNRERDLAAALMKQHLEATRTSLSNFMPRQEDETEFTG